MVNRREIESLSRSLTLLIPSLHLQNFWVENFSAKISQKSSIRGSPTEISDESMKRGTPWSTISGLFLLNNFLPKNFASRGLVSKGLNVWEVHLILEKKAKHFSRRSLELKNRKRARLSTGDLLVVSIGAILFVGFAVPVTLFMGRAFASAPFNLRRYCRCQISEKAISRSGKFRQV